MSVNFSYRTKLYAHYASQIHGKKCLTFDNIAAKRWCALYDGYLKGLLPQEKDAPILDVACGSGQLLYFLEQREYTNLHGVDISAEQVELSRQVLADVVEGDAFEYLLARPSEFELIFSLDIIEHFTKDEVLSFLEACFAALRPGGRLILRTTNAESPWGNTFRYGDLTHELSFSPTCLVNLLSIMGFSSGYAFESGPVPHGLVSAIRWLLWQIIRLILMIYNYVEVATKGSGVYTRVFWATGCKEHHVSARSS